MQAQAAEGGASQSETLNLESYMKENLTSLLDKTEKELAALGKTLLSKAAGACIALGKVIFTLQSKAPEGVSMAKFILSTIGADRADVPSVSWCVAVCCAYIGDGADKFSETDLDKTPARWLALASAIYSAIASKLADEKEPMNEAEAAGYREIVANVVRERPSNGYEQLKSVRDKLKGKGKGTDAKNGGGGGEQEQETAEEIPPVEKALAAMKEAARLLAESEPDTAQCAVFRRLAISIGKLAKLKGKSAPANPVAPLRMEGTTLAPVVEKPAGTPAARSRGRARNTPAAVTPLAAVFEKAAA